MTETKESKPSSPYNRIYPEWFDGKHLNEVLFCSEFLRDHPMKSINGAFFTTEGRITDENKLRKEVYDRSLMSVVFPAPLSPTSTQVSPGSRVKLTWFITLRSVPGYVKETSSNTMVCPV